MKNRIMLCAACALTIISITACAAPFHNVVPGASSNPAFSQPETASEEMTAPTLPEGYRPEQETRVSSNTSFNWSGNGAVQQTTTAAGEEETTKALQFSAAQAKKDDSQEDIVEDYIEDGTVSHEDRTDFVSVYDQFNYHYWDLGEVALGGNIINITSGTTFDALSQTLGLTWMDETDEYDTLDPATYVPRAVRFPSGQVGIVYLLNLGEETIYFRECMVLGVGSVAENEFTTFELANGINSNSSYDDIVNAMGEPDEVTQVAGTKVIRYISDVIGGMGPVAQFAISNDGYVTLFTYTIIDLS